MRPVGLLALSAVACHGGHSAGGASDASAMIDATLQHGVVTVHVIGLDGSVGAGIPIVFIDDEQTQVVNTDSSGQASATVLAGASVTSVIANATAGCKLWSVLATTPGDVITLDETETAPSTVGMFTVSFPASEEPVEVTSPCGHSAGGDPAIVLVPSNCEHDPTEILMNGVDGYADVMVPFVANGSVTMPTQLTPDVMVDISYSNIPSDVISLGFNWDTGGSENGNYQQPMADTLALHTTTPVGATLDVATTAVNEERATQLIDQPMPTTTTSATLDLGSNLLAWLQTPTIDLTTGVITTPTLSDGTTPDDPDLFALLVDYTGGPFEFVEWILYAPGPDNVKLPTIPASVADLTPAPDSSGIVNTAELFEADDVAGYAVAHLAPHLLTGGTVTPVTARQRRSLSPPQQ